MNNVDLDMKMCIAKPTLKQPMRIAKERPFPFISMATSHQGSFLQSKNKVSGEISKEPFLDILLTDLEQSSFSLIFKTKAHESVGLTRKKTSLPCLKTSTCLFSRTESLLTSKSFETQRITTLKTSHFFNPSRKLSFVKPFFAYTEALDLSKGSKSTNNLNLISVPVWRKPSSYLRYAKVMQSFALPSHSVDKNQMTKDQNFARNALQRQPESQWPLNMSANRDFIQEDRPVSCFLKVGDYIHSGDKIGYISEIPIVMTESGKILKVSQTQITIQKIQPVLFYSQAEIHVESNEWVKRGTPILTLTHQTLVTGDIVQGIPRIEQLFEASTAAPPGAALQDFGSPSDDDSSKRSSIDDYLRSHHTAHLLPPTPSFIGVRDQGASDGRLKNSSQNKENNDKISYNSSEKRYDSTVHSGTEDKPMFLYKTLQSQVRETFRKKWDQFPLPVAVRQSLEEIQQIIVESIQKVYISQGVLIADKHIEIIVRQMTSKAQVFDGGSTGLLIDEILSLQQIENANISTPGQKALYLPAVMGLTRSALSSDSFVSAASFQETTRVLSRDAIAGKTDFLRGLKEKVIIGDLIDAGTGLDAFYIYSVFSKKIFETKFREILNRKVTHKTLKKLVLQSAKPQQSNASLLS